MVLTAASGRRALALAVIAASGVALGRAPQVAADPAELRPFVVTDLTTRTTVGVESRVGTVAPLGTDHTVVSTTLGAAVQVAPRARVSASYGLGWIEDLADATASSIPARGDLTMAVTWLPWRGDHRWWPRLGVTGSTSLPIGGDKLDAATNVAWFNATADGSRSDNQIATARAAVDARWIRGRLVAQVQLQVQGRFATRAYDDGVVGGAAVAGGVELAPGLATWLTVSGMAGTGDCAVVCDDAPSADAVGGLDLGVRYDPRWVSLGVHAFVPVGDAVRAKAGPGLGVDVAFALDR